MSQFDVLRLVQSDKYCESGVIPFKLLGTDVTNKGQELPYFAAGLGSANQTVDIDIGSIIKESFGTTIRCK